MNLQNTHTHTLKPLNHTFPKSSIKLCYQMEVKSPKSNKSKKSENNNPNLNPSLIKSLNSPISKSASKLKKSGAKNPNGSSPLLKNRIRERKFVVAKKSKKNDGPNQSKGCKCGKGDGKLIKCLCVAYETLRASQQEFFKNGFSTRNDIEEALEIGEDKVEGNGNENGNVEGVAVMKRSREGVPEPGSGKVMSLVKAFEKMKMASRKNSNESGESEEKEGVRFELPGLEDDPKGTETRLSSSSLCPSDLFLTSECLGLDSRRSSSLDTNRGRNSSESFGAIARRKWRRKQKLKTTAKPFKLRTEERGKCKEEEFMKKVQQQMEEEEKLRVPIAQGLPWTTDEPECLLKPPLKEATRPIDLVLHSDVRAEERAEFDHQVAEKMTLIEQYRMERDRQQKLAEEEEIRRLRKVLVPKAQPMPYFDRPFIPRRSEKQPTIPKEPKFHFPQHKKSKCMQQSWSDTSSYISNSDSCYGL